MLLKKLGLSLLAVMLVVPMVLIPGPQKADADPAVNPAVIREGSTYLLDFETGSLASGTYHDGTSNALKFSGDTTHISLNDGQLVMGSLTGSTVGVFDYGFSSVPLDKYDNFEVSFDMTMTHREAGKQVGIQFQKNAWNDGWDAQLKTHFTYDGKMNFFEGSTSIANTDAGKYRSLKDYGAPGLNREVMPWETYRVKLVADGNRVQVFMNSHSAPVVDVLRASPVGQGFVGIFGNANTGFKLDNYLFNKLKPEAERDDFALSGDTAGMYVYIPPLNESVTKMIVRYQNLTDAAPVQQLSYTGERNHYLYVGGLMAGKEYKVELIPVYTSDRSNVDTEISVYKSKTVQIGQPLQTELILSEGETFLGATKQVDVSVIGADSIRYTLDGSEPTLTHGTAISGDYIFSDSVVIDHTLTFKAAAILDGEIKSSAEETYVAGVNSVQLTGSAVFHNTQQVNISSEHADAIIYTADGSSPLYEAAADTAANGTMVRASSASITLTETSQVQVLAVRDGVAGAIASAHYTKVALNSQLITSWNFTNSSVVYAQEQDDAYGKASAPWTNLLGWDVNADKGVWANHIVTDNVFRDLEGVHLFTTSNEIQATTSNPNFYLDFHDAGLLKVPAEYRYLSIWMKVNHTANAAVYFGTDVSADTNKLSESRKVAFRNTASEIPSFQRYIIDMGQNPGWTGSITKLRIDPMATYPSMKDGIEIAVKDIQMLRKQDLPAEVRLTTFETSSKEILSPGDTFEIKAVLENIGEDIDSMSVNLSVPDFIEVTPVDDWSQSGLLSGQSVTLTYEAEVTGTGAGGISLTVSGSGIPSTRGLSRIFSVRASLPASGQADDVIIGNAERRLVFPSPHNTGLSGYGFAWLEAQRNGNWSRMAVMPSLGSVQQLANDGQIYVQELYAVAPTAASPSEFPIGFTDPQGADWTGKLSINMDGDEQFKLEHALQADASRDIAAIVGPTLLLGEAGIPSLNEQHKVIRSADEATGDYIHEALFPGLEWLDAMELNNRSSDTAAVIDSVDAYRYVPNPRKITVPLMAVRKDNLLFGLMWDARQKWDGVHDQPSAFFGLPNRLERGEDTVSTKLSLFIPSMLNGINENATFATGIPDFYNRITANSNNENPVRQPYELGANEEIILQSRIFVKESTEVSSVVQDWIKEYGLPEQLDYAHGTMEQESEAILTSFENLWTPSENKWMNRIGPPATPTITSAFVMPYAVLGRYGGSTFRDLAEARVDSAMTSVGGNYSTYGYVLPFYLEGIAGPTLEALKSINVDSAISSAQKVNPSNVSDGVYWDYQTYITRKGFPASVHMGGLTDVTAGSNAEILFRMLRHARITGNESAVTYGLAGVDYMNEHFALPRGSQSWELRNMIPELETAAVAVRANVEAYKITENPDYIEQAQLWAGRGMPFIYLWDDGSYGIDKANGLGGSFGSHTFMRYGAIAAFGQSTYRSDGKPLPGTWFGRPVQWSGHDFGIALMELYEAMERNGLWNAYLMGGGTDYRTISLGLSVSGSRQTTAADNLYPAHLYDAASLLKWETSDYLYPNYQGAELLGALLGSKTNPITQTVPIGTKEIRISAATDIEVLSTSSASIQLRAGFSSPGSYTIFVQGITSLGNVLLSSNDADAVVSSFAVTSGSGFAEIHLQIGESGETEVNLSSVVLAP